MLGSIFESTLYDTTWFFFAVFLPCFSMLILSLPLYGLLSKSSSLSPGFYVHRPMQADSICWELNLISGFFGFFWLMVWLDVVNKCGWFLAGGRGCWLKGLHQIPIVSWIIHHLLHFHISLIYARNSVSIVLLLWRMGGWHTFGGGWLISGCGWRDKGRVLFNIFFLICAFVFCCFRSCFIF